MPQDHPIVLIIGPTGNGKSEFINLFVVNPKDKLVTGGGLKSVTQEVASRIVPNPGGSGVVELIDTPGLDDTDLSDNMMFLKISQYLSKRYKDDDHKVNGVIFVRKMEEMRMTNTAIRQTKLFEYFVGHDNFRNVLLLTSFWAPKGSAMYKTQETREVELLRDYWADMKRRNAAHARFSLHEDKSARDAMKDLLKQLPFTLQVVDEMVNQGKRYEDTALGAEADKHLEEVKAQAAEARREVEEMKKMISAKDQMMQQILEEQRQQFSRTIDSINARQKEARDQDEERYQGLQRELEQQAAERTRIAQQQQYYQQQQQQQPAPSPYDTAILLQSISGLKAEVSGLRQRQDEYDDHDNFEDDSDEDYDSDD